MKNHLHLIPPASEIKICNRCFTIRADEEFRINPRGLHGRQSICRICESKRENEHAKNKRKTDPEWHVNELRNHRASYHRHGEENRAKMRARSKDYQKNSFIRSVYGITLEQYNEILKSQNGVCAICHQKESRKSRFGGICKLHIDHDHESGKVRGLLCHACNFGIGAFNDDPNLLEASIIYLKER